MMDDNLYYIFGYPRELISLTVMASWCLFWFIVGLLLSEKDKHNE